MKVLYSADFRECSDKSLMCSVSERNDSEISENISFDAFVQSLTPAKKRFALSVIELYKRDHENRRSVEKIRNSSDIYHLMYPHLYGIEVEEFWAIFMNNSAKPIKAQRFTIGGLTSAVADPRTIMKEAILSNATCIAIIHNHPSGNMRPSVEDDHTTEKVKKISEVCGFKLLDHLIFAGDEYYSYADEGRL
jgi:DNA repair protein RadC